MSSAMSDQPIRTIIVDDEELARRGIELRLAPHADISIVRHCANGREALEAIVADQPDLMFLDIQMPGLSGFEVLARLPQESLPMVIFVTAYDRYALDAFEAQAIDYLLKPINDTRFVQALDRVRGYWQQRDALSQREQLMKLLASTQGTGQVDEQTLREYLHAERQPQYPQILPIRDDAGTVRVDVKSIDWIDAAGDYMCVHADGRTYVLRETMKSLEAVLDPEAVPARASLDHRQRVTRATAATSHQRRIFPDAGRRPGDQAQPLLPGSGDQLLQRR